MSELPSDLLTKMRSVGQELKRKDLPPVDRAISVADRALQALRLKPRASVKRGLIYELTSPPPVPRGFRDLLVRTAAPEDTERLNALPSMDPRLMPSRLAQHDKAFLGELNGRILAHVWFRPGPALFEEDSEPIASFSLNEGSWWSYHAAAVGEARTSGVFVKVFQTALRSLFQEHGARRVQCLVRATNPISITMHDRLGFRRLGSLVVLVLPGLRLVSWEGEGGGRLWLRRRRAPMVLSIPPSVRT